MIKSLYAEDEKLLRDGRASERADGRSLERKRKKERKKERKKMRSERKEKDEFGHCFWRCASATLSHASLILLVACVCRCITFPLAAPLARSASMYF
jgi:hypothetical protein